jgi:uncharacterized protein YpmB
MNKKAIIIIVAIILLLILAWVYFKYVKKKPTPDELEKKATEIRAEVAGQKYNSFMMGRAFGI